MVFYQKHMIKNYIMIKSLFKNWDKKGIFCTHIFYRSDYKLEDIVEKEKIRFKVLDDFIMKNELPKIQFLFKF